MEPRTDSPCYSLNDESLANEPSYATSPWLVFDSVMKQQLLSSLIHDDHMCARASFNANSSCIVYCTDTPLSHICVLRELWFRASLAWQQVLEAQQGHRNILLVAHNAVNQALVATAIGLPPTYFRRLLQNNAATTVLDFQPNGDGPPRVNVDRLNQVGAL